MDDNGQVALVYDPESYKYLHPHVRDDNRNFFKVSGLPVHVYLVLYLVQLMYTTKTHVNLFSISSILGVLGR